MKTFWLFDNLKLIKQSGISVYLKLNPESLTQRILHGKNTRPLFEGLDKRKILEKTKQLLKQRESVYQQADICINALNLDVNSLVIEIQSKFH